MSVDDILVMQPEQLDRMTIAEIRYVRNTTRHLRGRIYSATTAAEIRATERRYGMSILRMKAHTLALMDKAEELDPYPYAQANHS